MQGQLSFLHTVSAEILYPFQGYGSTEGGGIALMIGREECSRIGSVGRVSENVEVKIVDHITSKPLSVGQKGELLVRGPAVMTGKITSCQHIIGFSGLFVHLILTSLEISSRFFLVSLCRICW
jgi:acyl-CoA synthetase (AMP-forming)/AMP-acid ligase II